MTKQWLMFQVTSESFLIKPIGQLSHQKHKVQWDSKHNNCCIHSRAPHFMIGFKGKDEYK